MLNDLRTAKIAYAWSSVVINQNIFLGGLASVVARELIPRKVAYRLDVTVNHVFGVQVSDACSCAN